MQKQLINILKFVGFLSIGLGILYVVYQTQSKAYEAQCVLDGIASEECSLTKKIMSDFGSINYIWIMVVIACFMLSNWSRAMRWKMLLDPLGANVRASNGFWTINLGYFANLGLPRMGEVVRAATISRYENIPVEKVMGTIVVDRLLDVICLLIVVGLAFLLEFDTLYSFLATNMGQKIGGELFQNPIVLGILASGALSLGIVIVFWKKIINLPIIQKGLHIVKGFAEGLLAIREAKSPASFVLHTINIWFMYYAMAYFCFLAFPPTATLSPLVALMVYVFGAFGVLIPSPGGMGTYHVLVMAALSIYGINSTDSFSFANIFFFSVNIFGSIGFGILALILLPILNKSK